MDERWGEIKLGVVYFFACGNDCVRKRLSSIESLRC